MGLVAERIPGLGPFVEKLMDSISGGWLNRDNIPSQTLTSCSRIVVFVFTTLEPFLKPIMKQATSGLQLASGEVINNQDQYEVFNDPRAVSMDTCGLASRITSNVMLVGSHPLFPEQGSLRTYIPSAPFDWRTDTSG